MWICIEIYYQPRTCQRYNNGFYAVIKSIYLYWKNLGIRPMDLVLLHIFFFNMRLNNYQKTRRNSTQLIYVCEAGLAVGQVPKNSFWSPLQELEQAARVSIHCYNPASLAPSGFLLFFYFWIEHTAGSRKKGKYCEPKKTGEYFAFYLGVRGRIGEVGPKNGPIDRWMQR